MTHLQFRRMDEHRQFDTIDKSGVLLFDRQERFHTIHVYQLNTFFVEVHVHTHFNVPLKVKCYPAAHNHLPLSDYLSMRHICDN